MAPTARRRVWLTMPSLVLAAAVLHGCATTAGPAARSLRPTTSGSTAPGPTTARPTAPGPTTARPTAPAEPAPPQTAPPTSTAPVGPATSTLVTEPDQGMTPIYSLLSSASRSLDMTMYELADPEAESLLEEDARRGVVVRVLLDRDDAGQRVNGPAFGQLQAGGVQVRWAPNDYLFHQKTVTVDHRISAVMTLNLTSQYYPTTRDFAVLTTDPDDVAAIEQVFDADWASGQSAPGPGPTATDLVWSPGAGPALVALINGASRTLQVENEEMGDADITAALVAAAARGVRVQVTMTDDATWGRAFAELETGGVQVRTYTESAPLYIHAKVVVADGVTAYVGSQNFSYSSLDDNRELGVVTADPAVVAGLATTLTRDFDGAAPFGG